MCPQRPSADRANLCEETKMKSILHAALIVAVSGTAAMTAAPPAFAQASFRAGDVAIAYRDGYWDNHHVWHAWAREGDWKAFQNTYPEHYRDYNHDQDDHH
jgi:hypothetical protein